MLFFPAALEQQRAQAQEPGGATALEEEVVRVRAVFVSCLRTMLSAPGLRLLPLELACTWCDGTPCLAAPSWLPGAALTLLPPAHLMCSCVTPCRRASKS